MLEWLKNLWQLLRCEHEWTPWRHRVMTKFRHCPKCSWTQYKDLPSEEEGRWE